MILSENNLLDALQDWGDGMIAISSAYEGKGLDEACDLAGKILDKLYGFNMGPVLFKPTLSGGTQTFRSTRDGALSYFVGNNNDYPLDSGFAIKLWREVHYQTHAVFLDEKLGLWMGWVTLVDKRGDVTKVDKSFGYKLCEEGNLKIVLHHSSLPFSN